MSEWHQYRLGELVEKGHANLQTGPFGTMLNSSEYVSSGIPVIAVQDIGNNKLIHNKFVYVDKNTATRLVRYKYLFKSYQEFTTDIFKHLDYRRF